MTPHTERAAAAANSILALLEPSFGAWTGKDEQVAAIIAKHFHYDAAKLAKAELILAELRQIHGCDDDLLVMWSQHDFNRAKRLQSQHDALRLAAGRALEALEKARRDMSLCAGLKRYQLRRDAADTAAHRVEAAITALSAALAGDKGKET